MRDQTTRKSVKIAAGIMSILILAVVLLSVFYIAHEAGHDCTDESCPVCACIGQCEKALHQIGGEAVLQIAMAILFAVLLLQTCHAMFFTASETLYSQKVRLNN